MNLKTLRKLKLLTQIELANKLGIRQSTLSYWELGKTIPTRNKLEELAKALDVDVATIIACFYGEPKEIEL